METFNNFFEKIKKSGLFIVLGVFSFYFTINAIKGDRGIFKYIYLKNKVEQAEQERARYQSIKKDLEYKVSMLSEESLDLDYLEERARIVLNMVGNNEYIILDKDIDKR
jgi:cell division protein FtsB